VDEQTLSARRAAVAGSRFAFRQLLLQLPHMLQMLLGGLALLFNNTLQFWRNVPFGGLQNSQHLNVSAKLLAEVALIEFITFLALQLVLGHGQTLLFGFALDIQQLVITGASHCAGRLGARLGLVRLRLSGAGTRLGLGCTITGLCAAGPRLACSFIGTFCGAFIALRQLQRYALGNEFLQLRNRLVVGLDHLLSELFYLGIPRAFGGEFSQCHFLFVAKRQTSGDVTIDLLCVSTFRLIGTTIVGSLPRSWLGSWLTRLTSLCWRDLRLTRLAGLRNCRRRCLP
jgi:hypothetical protein